MKAILYIFLTSYLLCSLKTHAQKFSSTTGLPCQSCQPINYIKRGSPAISTPGNYGGDLSQIWNTLGFNDLPVPPSTYSQGLPPNGGKNTFVSLKTSEGAFKDSLFLDVSGFIVNKPYVFRYSVLSASVQKSGGNTSPFGELAKMEILTTGQNPSLLEWQTTTFNGSTQNKWIAKTITFTPTTSTLRFRLTGHTAGVGPGYINFDIDKFPFDCMLPSDEVELARATITTPFPGEKINLYETVIGPAPETGELVWKKFGDQYAMTPQQASSAPVSNLDPMNEKPYYAYYYASDFNCFNVQVSQAEFKFLHVPTQVELKQAYVEVSCTEPTTDLTKFLKDPIAPVIWYTSNNHQGSQVFNPQSALPGDYYAFYYNASKGGFSLPSNQVSSSQVKVVNPIMPGIPDLGPVMNIGSLIYAPNAGKDFVVKVQNIKAENSNCSVFFNVSKLPGFTITYTTQAGQSTVSGNTIYNNNDLWVFTENNQYITVTSKNGIVADGYSFVGFKITRNANTPADSKQNLSVTIPQPGGGGEINTTNNQTIITLTTN